MVLSPQARIPPRPGRGPPVCEPGRTAHAPLAQLKGSERLRRLPGGRPVFRRSRTQTHEAESQEATAKQRQRGQLRNGRGIGYKINDEIVDRDRRRPILEVEHSPAGREGLGTGATVKERS